MVTFNPVAAAARAVIAAAAAAGKGVLIKKPLNSGRLDPGGGADLVGRAMRFIFAEPGVSCALIGTLSRDHLALAVAAADQALGNAVRFA